MGFISVETQYQSADKAHGKILSYNFLRLDVNLFEQYHKDVSYDWLRERCHFRAKKKLTCVAKHEYRAPQCSHRLYKDTS